MDGRSDIFSFGVVLYELLVGRRPFRGKSTAEILESVTKVDPRPPRQANDHIPRELELICLKALSRRTTDRYTTALDMAECRSHVRHRGQGVNDWAGPSVASTQELQSWLRSVGRLSSRTADLVPGDRVLPMVLIRQSRSADDFAQPRRSRAVNLLQFLWNASRSHAETQ